MRSLLAAVLLLAATSGPAFAISVNLPAPTISITPGGLSPAIPNVGRPVAPAERPRATTTVLPPPSATVQTCLSADRAVYNRRGWGTAIVIGLCPEVHF